MTTRMRFGDELTGVDKMTLPEIIMASTILTWIVLSTVYRLNSSKRILKEVLEIRDILDRIIESVDKNSKDGEEK